MTKTPGMERIELRDAKSRGDSPRDIRTIIIEAFEKGGTLDAAAELLEVDRSTLSIWINHHLGGDVRSKVIFPGFVPAPEPAEALA